MENLKNELEHQLYAAQQGQTPSEVFMKQLMTAQVFMPIKGEPTIGGFPRPNHAEPLVVQDDTGATALILFSSPERAKPYLEYYPDFKGGLLTEFTWVLEKIGPGFGIAVNPGDELGIDLEAVLVEQMRAAMAR